MKLTEDKTLQQNHQSNQEERRGYVRRINELEGEVEEVKLKMEEEIRRGKIKLEATVEKMEKEKLLELQVCLD